MDFIANSAQKFFEKNFSERLAILRLKMYILQL